ncbi:MAG: tRNA (adenosine(37)-N6)-dimethylallyltransferase MiaA [Clostridiales bacterium]|nr:tRNA (adenosine(37)-N6)-dimethylallyltransferase MiaA [Clostridiales bacterium]
MNKILLIGGSTGVGKTKLSLLCKDIFNGYLISCDSMQIYKDMNIGTAKISKEEQKQYPHALIDIITPDKEFSVSEYVKLCKTEIDKARKLNKLPIIIGGTGLYMKSLLFPYSFNSTYKNEELRMYYENLCKEKGNEFVYNILKEKNPDRASKLHFNDTKRVIRALEILDNNNEIKLDEEKSRYNYELIVLTCERDILYDRINNRVEEMFNDGLLNEVKQVIKKYNLTRESQSMQAIGYREFFDYFEGLKTLDEVKDKIKQNSRHYAKRQITWFKTMPNAKFMNIENIDEIVSYLKQNL